MNEGITSLIVLQPTPFCNLDCGYCYLPQRNDRTRLSLDKLEEAFRRLLAFPTLGERVTIVWHAGEPLVLGVDYYESAFARIRAVCPHGLLIDHAFQTNGTLIDKSWCDLFRRWNVGLGVSIDGPQPVHDAMRRTRTGRGTYAETVAAIKCLQAHDIPFYVLSVLTRSALLEPDAMFSFWRELDIHDVGFNFEEQEGINNTSSFSADFDDIEVVKFFARLAELMQAHEFPVAIREFEQALASIRGLRDETLRDDQTRAFGIITVDVRGNVYTFSPELVGYSGPGFESFAIGNIFASSFEQLRASPVLLKMSSEIDRGVEMCRAECDYFKVCGGGAPSNKMFENGTFASTETMHCRLSKKRVLDFVLDMIESRLLPSSSATRLSPPLGSVEQGSRSCPSAAAIAAAVQR